MTNAQRCQLRMLIAKRSTQGIVEAEHHSCSPGRIGNGGTKSDTHSDLRDENGRVILDTLNSDVAMIVQPDSDTAYDERGRHNIDFVAAAWWAVPELLEEGDQLVEIVGELLEVAGVSGPDAIAKIVAVRARAVAWLHAHGRGW